MDGQSATQQTNIYKGRLQKKLKLKFVLSTLVTTWLSNIAFHLKPILLQTLFVINSESRLTQFPSFCKPPSEVAVLFNQSLGRRPFLRQVVALDLLLCTGSESEHMVLFLCHSFTQGPITDRKIEHSNGRCFGPGLQQFSPTPSKFSFHTKKK